MTPVFVTAHVVLTPAVTAAMSVNDDTLTGTLESVLFPFPSWPEEFNPQHFTVPFANTAHA
jgi:hypothetical protein